MSPTGSKRTKCSRTDSATCEDILTILDAEGREVTEQDRALYSLCRPERLLELAWRFILY